MLWKIVRTMYWFLTNLESINCCMLLSPLLLFIYLFVTWLEPTISRLLYRAPHSVPQALFKLLHISKDIVRSSRSHHLSVNLQLAVRLRSIYLEVVLHLGKFQMEGISFLSDQMPCSMGKSPSGEYGYSSHGINLFPMPLLCS